MKRYSPTVSYPNIVMEAASNIIFTLYENKWYEANNISCPDFSVFFLRERIMCRYMENCYYLPPYNKIFTKNEFKAIQDRIVENNILARLKEKKFILNDDQDNASKFYLSRKGVRCISEIIDENVLNKSNGFDKNRPLTFKHNIMLWLVEQEFLEANIDTSMKVIKKIEEVLFMLTPKGTAHLRHIVSQKLIKI